MARYLRSSASCLSNFEVLIFRIIQNRIQKGDAQRTACAQDRDRTGTVSLPLVFETSASTNSATWATSANCATKGEENSQMGKSQNDTLPRAQPKGQCECAYPIAAQFVLTTTRHALTATRYVLIATRHATSLPREKGAVRFQQSLSIPPKSLLLPVACQQRILPLHLALESLAVLTTYRLHRG